MLAPLGKLRTLSGTILYPWDLKYLPSNTNSTGNDPGLWIVICFYLTEFSTTFPKSQI
jgi:hypothetical protein